MKTIAGVFRFARIALLLLIFGSSVSAQGFRTLGSFSGLKLLVDTQVEIPPINNATTTAPLLESGETFQFQLYVPEASGKKTYGFTLGFDNAGNVFADNFFDQSGTDFDLDELRFNYEELSALMLGLPTVPSNGYLGTITLTARQDIEEGVTIAFRATMADEDLEKDSLDVTEAYIVFTAEHFMEGIRSDLDRDGDVDFSDFVLFAGDFGKTGPIPTDQVRTITRTIVVHDTIEVTETVHDTIEVTKTVHDTIEVTMTIHDTLRAPIRYANAFSSVSELETWDLSDLGNQPVSDGKLVIVGSSGVRSAGCRRYLVGDTELRVDTEWTGGVEDSPYGFAFGNSEVTYGIHISANGAYLIRRHDSSGTWETLKGWTFTDIVNKKGKNELKLIHIGDIVKAYINEELVFQKEDSHFVGGWTMLIVQGIQEIAFDNISVTVIEPSQIELLKPVPRGWLAKPSVQTPKYVE